MEIIDRPHTSRKTLSHYKCYRPSIETNNTVLNSSWYAGYSAIIVWCDKGLVRMQYGLIFIVIRPESRLVFFSISPLKNWHFHFFVAHEGIERPVGRWADWWIMKWMVVDELQIHLSRMKSYDDHYVLNCMYASFETKWWSGSFTGKMMWIDLEKWYRGVQCKTKSEIVNERDCRYSSYLT